MKPQNMKPTPEQLAKLPKWAQQHIEDIERSLKAAQTRMANMDDQQTPSPVYIEEWPENKIVRRYVQVPYSHVTIKHAGVHLDIYLAREKDAQWLYGIELTYAGEVRNLTGCEVAIIPRSVNTIQLVNMKYMR